MCANSGVMRGFSHNFLSLLSLEMHTGFDCVSVFNQTAAMMQVK